MVRLYVSRIQPGCVTPDESRKVAESLIRLAAARLIARGAMKLNVLSPRAWLLLGCAAVSAGSVGCQATVGGQTLPSAYYLRDDVQFFPAGPEFKLSREVQAIEEYKLRQSGAAGEVE